ncbi:MAG: hypothetical protein ACXVYY_09505 [Oryzihumus sp.]
MTTRRARLALVAVVSAACLRVGTAAAFSAFSSTTSGSQSVSSYTITPAARLAASCNHIAGTTYQVALTWTSSSDPKGTGYDLKVLGDTTDTVTNFAAPLTAHSGTYPNVAHKGSYTFTLLTRTNFGWVGLNGPTATASC